MIKTALAKLLTLKAAAVIAALSAGGLAVAASTGALPNPLGHDSPAPAHSTNDDRGDGAGKGTPSPSLQGLCTAFLAGAGADHGKALESPAFQVLVTAAGGKDKVASYCASLGVSAPGSAATDHRTGAPDSHPTGKAGDHAADPSDPPAHAPTALPTPSTPAS